MATIRKTSKGLALDLPPEDRAKFARLVEARMAELNYGTGDAATATTLSTATIRAWFREVTGTTTVTLWALVAVCRGLGIDIDEVAEVLELELDPKAVAGAERNYRQRRARNGQPAEPPTPTRRSSSSVASGTSSGLGPALREAIIAIVDERLDERLAELLTV